MARKPKRPKFRICWGGLTPYRRRRLIADRIVHAKSIGIVSRDGEPLCTRPR